MKAKPDAVQEVQEKLKVYIKENKIIKSFDFRLRWAETNVIQNHILKEKTLHEKKSNVLLLLPEKKMQYCFGDCLIAKF